jgi:hypothetical protein
MANKFNWEIYKKINPDLIRAGLRRKQQFERHYFFFGKKEGRKIKEDRKITNIAYNTLKQYLINNKYVTFTDLNIKIFLDDTISNNLLNIIKKMNDITIVNDLNNCDLAILSKTDENIIKSLGIDGKFVFLNYSCDYPNTVYYDISNINVMFSKIYYFQLNRYILKDILINSVNNYINNKDRIRTYVYVPVWERHDLLEKCINSIKNQTEQCDIVCLCSTINDFEYVKSLDILALLTVNKPLSEKYQIGIDFGKVYYPKNVIIMGSDDIMSSNYVQNINKYIEKYDLVGLQTWKILYNDIQYNCKYNHKIINGFWGDMFMYNNKLTGFNTKKIKTIPFCIGAGRSIGYKLLNKMNWDIYIPYISSGLDTLSLYKMLVLNDCKYINSETFDHCITSLKTDIDMITDMKKIINSKNINCYKIIA